MIAFKRCYQLAFCLLLLKLANSSSIDDDQSVMKQFSTKLKISDSIAGNVLIFSLLIAVPLLVLCIIIAGVIAFVVIRRRKKDKDGSDDESMDGPKSEEEKGGGGDEEHGDGNDSDDEKDEMEEQQTQQNPTADGEYEQVAPMASLVD